MVRIVAGEFKGRRLHAPRGAATRPTADRVREALFSILGDVSGARVLDLYAGSGALGIEALSRGAESALFVERDRRALAALRRNLDAVGADAEVRNQDALRFIAHPEGVFDLVFCDPPYDEASRVAAPLSEALPAMLEDRRSNRDRIRQAQPADPPAAARGRADLWRHPDSDSLDVNAPRNGGTAVVPGSYDPVTFGHIDIITRVANVFDTVIVGVVNQAVRKGKTVFSAEERVAFIESEVAEYANVQVKPFDTLLVDFARDNGAKAIVKGLRAISDFEYEFEMNQLNRKMAPDIESMFMMAAPEFSFLSSSGVKEMAMFGGDMSGLVPDRVASRLKEELKR